MAANYGLLGDMASGIKEGLIAYQTTKNMERQNQMFNLLHGTQEDDQGKLDFTPEMKAQRAAQIQQQTMSTQRSQDALDPNSSQSQAARGLLKSMGINAPETASAADLKDYMPAATARIKGDATVSAAETRADAAEERAGRSQPDKTFDHVADKLQTARGLPAVAQAEKDLYAADKAKSLANMYGDPNKLNPQMVKLFVSEVGKIAQGGAPTQHELEGLNPSVLNGAMAEAYQKLMSRPSAANVGEFVKQYQDYARLVSNDAQNVIKSNYGRILGSYKKKLKPDDYQNLNDQYLNRFPQEAPQQGLLQGQGQAQGQAQAQPVKKEYNPTLDKTRITMSDGSVQMMDGRK